MKKLRDAIYGHLVADAVGTPYEFKSPMQIPSFENIDMIPPPGFKKSWQGVPYGSWSDDGSQTLCLLEYYSESPNEWPSAWANKLLKWQKGHLWVNGIPFDSGNQTAEALGRIAEGVDPLDAAGNSELSNGNGSLMRALPTAFTFFDAPDAEFFTEVANISSITHNHIRSKLCCMFYCQIARELISGIQFQAAIFAAKEKLEAILDDVDHKEWDLVWDYQRREPCGTGYVLDALWSAIYSLNMSDSYEECIRRCIELGNDTDTTACIAGGLAGIIYGYDGIPSHWIDLLKDKHVVEQILEKFNNS